MADEIVADRNRPHVDDDLCTDFVHGLLPAAQREVVLEHVRTCPACETLLRTASANYEMSRAHALPARSETKTLRLRSAWDRFGNWQRTLTAAAALAAIALWVAEPWRSVPDPALVYWVPTDREMVRLRSEGEPPAAFAAGLVAYAQHDAGRAVALLQEAGALTGPVGAFRDLYLASALTLDGKPRRALDVLLRLDIPTLPQPWQDEALWVHYIALHQSGERAAAGRILDELAGRPGAIGDRARARRQVDSHDTRR